MAIAELVFIALFAVTLLVPAFRRDRSNIRGYPTIENGKMQFNTPE